MRGECDPPILVTGATGAQGGAVIDALLAAGHSVRALVRDPDSDAAAKLAARGVALRRGDFDDSDALANAAAGAAGLFSVQLPSPPDDPGREARHGRMLVAAAETAGVRHIVHTSVARAGEHEAFAGWAEGCWEPNYWLGKAAVNAAVRAARVPCRTILQPAFLFDNFVPPKAGWMFPTLRNGVIGSAMDAEARLDLVSAADVGRLAAAAFAAPTRFDGQTIDLAAESLTMAEVAARIGDATGSAIVARHVAAEEAIAMGISPGLVESQRWASIEGYRVDPAYAKAWGVTLEPFAAWARRHRANFDVPAPQA